VNRARSVGLAGATVFRGIMGLDIGGSLLESSRWSIVEHVPVIVEIVDEARRIGRFLSNVEEIVQEGIATLERAHVLLYRHGAAPAGRANKRYDLPGAIEPLSTLPDPEEFPTMKQGANGQLVRVFIGETDRWEGQPLYRAIVLKAKDLGLAGATVLRGPMGFGANSRIHTTKLLDLSTDLPIVVEMVDSAEKIATLIPFLDEMVSEGMITIEDVRVLCYRHTSGKVRFAPPGESGGVKDCPV
jgi:PII-like signaling protein